MSVPLQFLAGAVRILLIPALCASLAFAPTARAGLVSTHDVLRQSVSLTEARARVQAVIARPEVASRLEALGVGADEARARVQALSDTEVARLDGRIQSLPAGGDFLGFVLGVVVVTFVVLVITDVFGITDVFTFINPVARRSGGSNY